MAAAGGRVAPRSERTRQVTTAVVDDLRLTPRGINFFVPYDSADGASYFLNGMEVGPIEIL
jgi:hypothetical protein